MCFNAEVSISTYILGLIGSFILYKKGYPKEAILYFFVIQMQLIEYFLWKNQTCNSFNKFITKIGIILNHLQPIILYLLIKYFNDGQSFILPKWLDLFMVIFVIMTIYYTKYVMNDDCSLITVESNPHIEWLWNNKNYGGIYYLLFILIVVLLTYYGLSNGKLHSAIILIGYVISYLIYNKKKSVGSIWCFYAAFAPWLLTFLYK